MPIFTWMPIFTLEEGGGATSLDEVENMAALQSFTVGGSGGMFPQENLIISGVLRRILVHCEAYREAHRAS